MPEAILPIVMISFLLIFRLFRKKCEYTLSARIAMSVMMISTGIAHFIYVKGMTMMIPKTFPFKTEIVYLTGVLEVCFALFLLIPRYQKITGWLLILFFFLILPANIYGAAYGVDMKYADYSGKGVSYLFLESHYNYFLSDGFIFHV